MTDQLEHWRRLWETTYREAPEPADPELPLAGWTNSYTGLPLGEAEMREWVEGTVERILGLGPRRLLEIGCGAGLLLRRLAPRLEEYAGTDFSPAALERAGAQAATVGGGGVTLFERPADDLSGLPDGRFDTLVLNSVVQYFPGRDYLEEVLRGALGKLAPGGRIFLGDLRSRPHLAAFHLSVLLAQSAPETPLAELRRRLDAAVAGEPELTLGPDDLAALRRALPRVTGVEIQLKRGRHRNELTRFRYDAVLHLDEAGEALAEPAEWRAWGDPEAAPPALRRHLAAAAPAALGVRGVPNVRLAAEVEALARLTAAGPDLATAGDLAAALGRPAGLDPEPFWALERSLPYRVEARWGEPAGGATFDVVLGRRPG